MNRDEIIRMAREAGWGGDAAEAWADGYEAGAAAEREACAELCDHIWMHGPVECEGADQCADAIRARRER